MNSNGNRRLPHNIQKKGKSKQEIRRKKRRSSDPIVDYIMNLQRTVGNKRVEELIKSGTIQPDSISREIYAVQKKEAVSASESFIRTKMPDVWNGLLDARAQAKLKVGSSNDIFEQEADRVAESVVNMSDADVRRKNDSVEVRAKGNFNSSFTADSAVESGIRSMKGGGNTLSSPVRRFYEARFNRDFGGVRIHTGNKADFLNRSINARAFTTGKDIFFAKGEFSPGSRSGKVLLAHELTHVVQQNKGLRAKRPVLEKYRISRKPVSADVKLSAGTMISRKYEQPKNSKYLHNYIRPIPQIVKDLYERDYTFSVKELNHWACGHFVQVFDANGDRVFKKYIKGNPNFRLTRDVVKKGKAGGKKKNWIVSVEVTKTMAFWGTKKAKYFPHTYTRFYVFDTHKEQTKTLKPVKKQYGSYHWVQKKVYADADERKAVIIMNPSAATIYVGNEVQYGIPRLTRSKSQTTLAVENMLGWNAENRFLINTSGFAFDPSMCRWEIYYDKRSYRKYRKKGRKLSRRLSYGYRDRIKFSPEIPGNHLIRLTIYNHRTRKKVMIDYYQRVRIRKDPVTEFKKTKKVKLDASAHTRYYQGMLKWYNERLEKTKFALKSAEVNKTFRSIEQHRESIKYYEEEIERLDAALAATGVLTNGMVMPLNAVLIPDKDPRKKQLNLFAKDTAEGMILIDTSRGNFTYQYRGKWDEKESDSPREKLRKSFKASWDLYVKENRNAAGYIVINPPPHLRFKRKTWKAKSDGISTAQVWKERAQTIGVVTAIGVAALALVPEPSGATKVLAATLSVAGGIAGAASGGFNLYERWQRGNVYWDNATALDLSTIAGSIVAAGVNATAIRYASVGKSAALAKSGLGKAVCLGEGLNLGVEIGKFLVIKNDLFHKINKFNDLELQKKVRYSSWEKETIVENLLIQGISQGLVIVGSVASLKGHIKQAGHLPDSKPAFKPKRVYSSEKVFNKYGKEKFPGFEKVKFKKGGERITGDQKVPKGKKSGGSLKEFPHYRNGESIIKSSRTLTKKGSISSLKSHIKKKLQEGVDYLPGGTQQTVVVTVKGNKITKEALKQLRKDIEDIAETLGKSNKKEFFCRVYIWNPGN